MEDIHLVHGHQIERALDLIDRKEMACHIEHQAECEISGRGRHGVGGIGNRDSFLKAVGDIDIIVTDGIVCHHFQFGGMVDQFLVYREIEHRAQHVILRNHL